ncbi:unnamed protein product [Amoebophrya sp. A25]|nr:unnamed protein product [Amoebophrya sp. A25]|eukprot:GSA25T00014293001.1
MTSSNTEEVENTAGSFNFIEQRNSLIGSAAAASDGVEPFALSPLSSRNAVDSGREPHNGAFQDTSPESVLLKSTDEAFVFDGGGGLPFSGIGSTGAGVRQDDSPRPRSGSRSPYLRAQPSNAGSPEGIQYYELDFNILDRDHDQEDGVVLHNSQNSLPAQRRASQQFVQSSGVGLVSPIEPPEGNALLVGAAGSSPPDGKIEEGGEQALTLSTAKNKSDPDPPNGSAARNASAFSSNARFVSRIIYKKNLQLIFNYLLAWRSLVYRMKKEPGVGSSRLKRRAAGPLTSPHNQQSQKTKEEVDVEDEDGTFLSVAITGGKPGASTSAGGVATSSGRSGSTALVVDRGIKNDDEDDYIYTGASFLMGGRTSLSRSSATWRRESAAGSSRTGNRGPLSFRQLVKTSPEARKIHDERVAENVGRLLYHLAAVERTIGVAFRCWRLATTRNILGREKDTASEAVKRWEFTCDELADAQLAVQQKKVEMSRLCLQLQEKVSQLESQYIEEINVLTQKHEEALTELRNEKIALLDENKSAVATLQKFEGRTRALEEEVRFLRQSGQESAAKKHEVCPFTQDTCPYGNACPVHHFAVLRRKSTNRVSTIPTSLRPPPEVDLSVSAGAEGARVQPGRAGSTALKTDGGRAPKLDRVGMLKDHESQADVNLDDMAPDRADSKASSSNSAASSPLDRGASASNAPYLMFRDGTRALRQHEHRPKLIGQVSAASVGVPLLGVSQRKEDNPFFVRSEQSPTRMRSEVKDRLEKLGIHKEHTLTEQYLNQQSAERALGSTFSALRGYSDTRPSTSAGGVIASYDQHAASPGAGTTGRVLRGGSIVGGPDGGTPNTRDNNLFPNSATSGLYTRPSARSHVVGWRNNRNSTNGSSANGRGSRGADSSLNDFTRTRREKGPRDHEQPVVSVMAGSGLGGFPDGGPDLLESALLDMESLRKASERTSLLDQKGASSQRKGDVPVWASRPSYSSENDRDAEFRRMVRVVEGDTVDPFGVQTNLSKEAGAVLSPEIGLDRGSIVNNIGPQTVYGAAYQRQIEEQRAAVDADADKQQGVVEDVEQEEKEQYDQAGPEEEGHAHTAERVRSSEFRSESSLVQECSSASSVKGGDTGAQMLADTSEVPPRTSSSRQSDADVKVNPAPPEHRASSFQDPLARPCASVSRATFQDGTPAVSLHRDSQSSASRTEPALKKTSVLHGINVGVEGQVTYDDRQPEEDQARGTAEAYYHTKRQDEADEDGGEKSRDSRKLFYLDHPDPHPARTPSSHGSKKASGHGTSSSKTSSSSAHYVMDNYLEFQVDTMINEIQRADAEKTRVDEIRRTTFVDLRPQPRELDEPHAPDRTPIMSARAELLSSSRTADGAVTSGQPNNCTKRRNIIGDPSRFMKGFGDGDTRREQFGINNSASDTFASSTDSDRTGAAPYEFYNVKNGNPHWQESKIHHDEVTTNRTRASSTPMLYYPAERQSSSNEGSKSSTFTPDIVSVPSASSRSSRWTTSRNSCARAVRPKQGEQLLSKSSRLFRTIAPPSSTAALKSNIFPSSANANLPPTNINMKPTSGPSSSSARSAPSISRGPGGHHNMHMLSKSSNIMPSRSKRSSSAGGASTSGEPIQNDPSSAASRMLRFAADMDKGYSSKEDLVDDEMRSAANQLWDFTEVRQYLRDTDRLVDDYTHLFPGLDENKAAIDHYEKVNHRVRVPIKIPPEFDVS